MLTGEAVFLKNRFENMTLAGESKYLQCKNSCTVKINLSSYYLFVRYRLLLLKAKSRAIAGFALISIGMLSFLKGRKVSRSRAVLPSHSFLTG